MPANFMLNNLRFLWQLLDVRASTLQYRLGLVTNYLAWFLSLDSLVRLTVLVLFAPVLNHF